MVRAIGSLFANSLVIVVEPCVVVETISAFAETVAVAAISFSESVAFTAFRWPTESATFSFVTVLNHCKANVTV